MSDLDAARALLSAAQRDLAALKRMRKPDEFALEVFGFHAQQAVEKCLKAWLAILDAEYPLTHNLRVLLSLLAKAGADVADLWNLVALNPFAVQFRYDAFDAAGESLDRRAAARDVSALFKRVTGLLEKRRRS